MSVFRLQRLQTVRLCGGSAATAFQACFEPLEISLRHTFRDKSEQWVEHLLNQARRLDIH
jgi:hypothetical protein